MDLREDEEEVKKRGGAANDRGNKTREKEILREKTWEVGKNVKMEDEWRRNIPAWENYRTRRDSRRTDK